MSRRSRSRNDSNGHIEAILLVEIPPSTPMCSRPLKPTATGDLIEELLDEYDHVSENGRYSDPGTLAGIANKAFQFDGDHERTIKTTNYNKRRFVVLIKMRNKATGSTSHVDYISGFTDMYDFNNRGGDRGDIAPDTRIYFNSSVKTVHVDEGNDRKGRRVQIDRTNQILGNTDQGWYENNRRSRRGKRDDSEQSITPHRMVQKLANSSILSDMLEGTTNGELSDGRNLIYGPSLSSYEDRIPSSYLSRISEGLEKATRTRRTNSSRSNRNADNDTEYYSSATKVTGESRILSIPFFKEINNSTDWDEYNYVTWEDLERVFPEVDEDSDDIVEIIAIDWNRSSRGERSILDDIINSEDTEDWSSRDMTTQIANHVASSIPPLLADLMLSEVNLIITNDTRRGKVEVTPGDMVQSLFKEFDDPDALDTLCDRVKEYIIDGMPFTKTTFHIDGVFSLVRATNVVVAYDGEREVPYHYASYSDAVATPLITVDNDRVEDIVSELSGINEHIYNRSGRARARSEDYDLNEDDIKRRRR